MLSLPSASSELLRTQPHSGIITALKIQIVFNYISCRVLFFKKKEHVTARSCHLKLLCVPNSNVPVDTRRYTRLTGSETGTGRTIGTYKKMSYQASLAVCLCLVDKWNINQYKLHVRIYLSKDAGYISGAERIRYL